MLISQWLHDDTYYGRRLPVVICFDGRLDDGRDRNCNLVTALIEKTMKTVSDDPKLRCSAEIAFVCADCSPFQPVCDSARYRSSSFPTLTEAIRSSYDLINQRIQE